MSTTPQPGEHGRKLAATLNAKIQKEFKDRLELKRQILSSEDSSYIIPERVEVKPEKMEAFSSKLEKYFKAYEGNSR